MHVYIGERIGRVIGISKLLKSMQEVRPVIQPYLYFGIHTLLPGGLRDRSIGYKKGKKENELLHVAKVSKNPYWVYVCYNGLVGDVLWRGDYYY